MSTQPLRRYTPEEYLALESAADYKSEYLNGHIYAMAGATPVHTRMLSSTVRALGNALDPGPCSVYPSELRVRVEETGLYTYPDIAVVCQDEQFSKIGGLDTLLNPILLIEILSDSTERYDRGAKFQHYQKIPSLQEYVLISQNKPLIESYLRQHTDDQWMLTIANGLETTILLKSVGVALSLADVYRRVSFPPELTISDR